MNQNENKLKKMLLMGQHKVGKTSMHSIIFANTPPNQVMQIGLTVDVNQNSFKFMGNLKINLWDCGGQDKLLQEYFTTQKSTIFSNVEVLIYVFDVDKEGDLFIKELNDFKTTVTSLSECSPGAIVFVLIHKFDKIKESERKIVFERKYKEIIQRADGLNIEIKDVFSTSIWDETLYKAWSQIVQNLIPNINIIKESLKAFCQTCSCEEVVLFEKSTFLIIDFQETNEKKDIQKYERLSNIIKQFKLTCMKTQASIQAITVKSEKFTVYIDEFTENTFIMLAYTDPSIYPAAISHNVHHAQKLFESIQGSDTDKLKYLTQRKS
ncbi:unnamed protein product [Paramecium octaurelia]|uniref:GTP-binding protein n=1 Tax=Paramecium octaurelia TaxID=43137 RepID=A0A8S1S566_PAROT|nr:unnamed protein product [Paramecium octaurelia]